jgi:Flp pilus assembly pilin Flp
MMARFTSVLRDERGNSLIEMALAAPIFAALLIGMVDLSRAVSAKVALEQAAQRAIEKIQAADFKTSDEDGLVSDAEDAAGVGSTATVDAWLECDHDGTHLDFDTDNCTAGHPFARYVEVSIDSSFTPIFGTRYFPGANADGTVPVNGHAVLRVQ